MIDVIAETEGISLSKMQFKALFGKGNPLEHPILLSTQLKVKTSSAEIF
jgi:hypothetical protein